MFAFPQRASRWHYSSSIHLVVTNEGFIFKVSQVHNLDTGQRTASQCFPSVQLPNSSICKGGKWHHIKFNLDAVNRPCKQRLAGRAVMWNAIFLLETDCKIHLAGAEVNDVTRFQIWMAAGGKGHLLISWWKKLMLRSQFQRGLLRAPSYSQKPQAWEWLGWKEVCQPPSLSITLTINRVKRMGTSAQGPGFPWLGLTRTQSLAFCCTLNIYISIK